MNVQPQKSEQNKKPSRLKSIGVAAGIGSATGLAALGLERGIGKAFHKPLSGGRLTALGLGTGLVGDVLIGNALHGMQNKEASLNVFNKIAEDSFIDELEKLSKFDKKI